MQAGSWQTSNYKILLTFNTITTIYPSYTEFRVQINFFQTCSNLSALLKNQNICWSFCTDQLEEKQSVMVRILLAVAYSWTLFLTLKITTNELSLSRMLTLQPRQQHSWRKKMYKPIFSFRVGDHSGMA